MCRCSSVMKAWQKRITSLSLLPCTGSSGCRSRCGSDSRQGPHPRVFFLQVLSSPCAQSAAERRRVPHLGVEVASALAAAHGQRGQAVLEDLLKAEELDDAQRDARVEAQPPWRVWQRTHSLPVVSPLAVHSTDGAMPGSPCHILQAAFCNTGAVAGSQAAPGRLLYG